MMGGGRGGGEEEEGRRGGERGRGVDTQTYTADLAAHTWMGHAHAHKQTRTHTPGGASKSH